MTEINLLINGKAVVAEEGQSVLAAALAHNIYIPHLCDHPDLKPTGACRLCLVEIAGQVVTACTTQVSGGLEVKTDTAEIERVRKTAVELLLINHERNCLECASDASCELQKVAQYVGIELHDLKKYGAAVKRVEIDDSNPFFNIDHNKCIKCGICIRTCDELQNLGVIDFANRGYDTVVSTFDGRPLIESDCKSCGECAVRCPTGAMTLKTQQTPTREEKTICPYCGCGCGMYLGVRGNTIVSARGDRENPSNSGSLCVKGRFGYEFVNSPERLTTPLIKESGEFRRATWDEALDLIAKKLAAIKGDKFALLASAKATNEDNYVLQKFTRAVMGTNNVDHCARLCHSPTVAGLVQSFGSGAMTNTTKDIGMAKCIFAIGTNTTAAHPIIALQVKKMARNGGVLIVANPRKIDLCKHATIFLQHKPGTDVALMMGMMRVIVDENLHDKSFIKARCDNFKAFKKSLGAFDLDFVEETTGVDREKIVAAARAYAKSDASSILYSMGITQHSHGTDNVLATSNLALLTGNVGRPGTGVNPLRGQNNVQGACDMGALPNVYPGYQKVIDAKSQEKFESIWGAKLSNKVGLTHMEMFDAIVAGEIEFLYIVGENPVLSEANASHVIEALNKIKFFVAQDIFLTETAQFADVVLPAVTYAEKDGAFTNTERRVQRVRKIIEPIGDAKPDWWIICQLAKKLLTIRHFVLDAGSRSTRSVQYSKHSVDSAVKPRNDDDAIGFDFENAEQIMTEIAAVTPSYAGINYARLESVAGLQWPCPNNEHPGTPILHTEKFATASGKGNFMPLVYKPSAELPDDEYPLILTTDRSLFHFHTATMTRKVKGLVKLRPFETVRINSVDADNLNIVDGEMIRVISRRGEVEAKAKVTDASPVGVIAMTFHFAESPTNMVTNPALDPVAKIPETKVAAVRIEKV